MGGHQLHSGGLRLDLNEFCILLVLLVQERVKLAIIKIDS